MKMFCALLLSFSSLLGMAQTNQKALDDFSTRFGGEASWANEGGQIVAVPGSVLIDIIVSSWHWNIESSGYS